MLYFEPTDLRLRARLQMTLSKIILLPHSFGVYISLYQS